MIDGLLTRLEVASFHLYLDDYGAAVGLHLATRAPRRIRSLIVQNANAHESGFDLEETLSWMKALPRMEAHSSMARISSWRPIRANARH